MSADHAAENDLTLQSGESISAFSIRRIGHDAWVAGHDSGCVVSLHPCWHHASPFADTSVIPPAVTEPGDDA